MKISGPLREFLGVDHLHFKVEGADCFSIFVGFPSKNVVADTLVFSIVTQDRFWNWRFQVVNFDVQQVFDEGLGDMLVAEYKSEHNWIGNVKFIKRFYTN